VSALTKAATGKSLSKTREESDMENASIKKDPQGWNVKTVGQVFDFYLTATYSRDKQVPQDSSESAIKYILYGDIHTQDNMLLDADEAIASVQNSIAAAERLKKSLMQNLLTCKMKPDGTFRIHGHLKKSLMQNLLTGKIII